MTSRNRQVWLVLGLLIPCVLAGCGLFDPREAEDPGGVEQVPWTPPTSMLTALRNIELTIEAKSTTNYERSLADEFEFEPDLVDEQLEPGFFDEWGRQEEINAMSVILSTSAEVSLNWDVGDSIIDPQDSYYEDLGYELRFQSASLDTVFSGNVDLHFLEDNEQWFVTRWVDNRDGSGNKTWGLLRRSPTLPE